MQLKMPSEKWRSFCLGPNVLKENLTYHHAQALVESSPCMCTFSIEYNFHIRHSLFNNDELKRYLDQRL